MTNKYIIPALIFAVTASFAQDATWIPANAVGAVKVDAKKLSEKPLFAKVGERAKSTGFGSFSLSTAPFASISNDFSKVLVVLLPGGKGAAATSSEPSVSVVTYVSGTFDNAKLTKELEAMPGCKTAVVDGQTLYSVVVKELGLAAEAPSYFAFPKKGVFAVADKSDTLLAGLKVVNGKAPAIKRNSKIAVAIAKDFPLVTVADLKAMGVAGGQAQGIPLETPSLLAMTLRDKAATEDMILSLTGVFDSAEKAEQTADLLSQYKGILGLQFAANPNALPLVKAISALKISARGDNVVSALTLDEALLDALADSAVSALTGAGSAPLVLPAK